MAEDTSYRRRLALGWDLIMLRSLERGYRFSTARRSKGSLLAEEKWFAAGQYYLAILSVGKRVPKLLVSSLGISNMQNSAEMQKAPQSKQKLLLVVSKGTMDGLYPALILATTAAAQQWTSVDMYFTFGGMKLLTKGMAESIKPSVDFGMSKEELTALLAKGGMPSLLDMLKGAKDAGVHIYACSPTMGLYGMKKEQVLDICDDIIGASRFLQMASDPDALTLFI